VRHATLAPPRPIGPDSRLDHRHLSGPRPAVARHRRLFHPVTGWFRRLERRTEQLLSTHLFPRLPGLPAIYSRLLERHVTLVDGTIAVEHLPASEEGLRILLITDIHVGPFLEPEALARVFARLMATRPDLILLGGDLATARLDEFPPAAGAFRTLAAPRGVFAVLGNHDHYTREPERLTALIEECGIGVLHNRWVPLGPAGGASLVLAGIDDRHSGRPDLDAALAGIPAGAPVILLSHNPDVLFDAAARGVSLVLSGHTHGGQIRIPGLPVLVRMSRYRLDEGHYGAGGTQLVVSRGLGVTGLPIRIACPPEAVLLTLTGAGVGSGAGPAAAMR